MHEIRLSEKDKERRYRELLPQIYGIVGGEPDVTANLANIAAVLKEAIAFFWVGFYLVKPAAGDVMDEELVLGPFQGPVACTRISYGKGVCGTVWKEGRSIVVEDVERFPGHIACSALSRSEIVIPLLSHDSCCEADMPSGSVIGVLDIDSDVPGAFDEVDLKYLEELCGNICRIIWDCKK